jgi:alpha-tubulin suppressor-like RCC1 family protein
MCGVLTLGDRYDHPLARGSGLLGKTSNCSKYTASQCSSNGVVHTPPATMAAAVTRRALRLPRLLGSQHCLPERSRRKFSSPVVSGGYETPSSVFSWGRGAEFALGHGDPQDRDPPTRVVFPDFEEPLPPDSPANDIVVDRRAQSVVQVAAGNSFSVALTARGDVYEWGSVLGPWDEEDELWQPTFVQGLCDHRIRSIACGVWHALAVTDDGRLFAWGLGSNAQLAPDGSSEPCSNLEPQLVEALDFEGNRVSLAAAGAYHSTALCADGKVWGWGFAGNGALGAEAETPLCFPQPIALPTTGTPVHVACGSLHTAVVTDSGEVVTLGGGALAPRKEDHELNDSPAPAVRGLANAPLQFDTRIVTLPQPVVNVACGNGTTLAITTAGEVYVWGDSCGEAPTKVEIPVPDDPVVLGSLGEGRGAVLTESGRLFSWALPPLQASEDPAAEIIPFEVKRVLPNAVVDSVALGWDFSLVAGRHSSNAPSE